jgi:proteasome lid subunit RPN8/RPN11
MSLTLDPHHLQQIKTHAEHIYPQECCGLLLGQHHGDRKIVVEVRSTPNVWAASEADSLDTTRRYAIDPKDMLIAQQEGRDRNLNIIGIYHSHPDHPAVPSECDRACAWTHYSYMIISVRQGVAQDCLCWSLNDHHQFQLETLLMAFP